MAEIVPGQAYGFFTDTSVCIGCKACEVACKQWNMLSGHEPSFLDGYDNTGQLDSQNWRYVQMIDNVPDETMGTGQGKAWLMMSDVCKHCQHASCMDEETNVAHKCTLCYARPQGGMEPACAKACPTQSIQFGPLDELQQRADKRLADLHSQGVAEANLYGRDEEVYGGLNAFFLLMDKPEAYRLPNAANATLPGRNNAGGWLTTAVTAVLGVLGGLIALRRRQVSPQEPPPTETPPTAEAGAR